MGKRIGHGGGGGGAGGGGGGGSGGDVGVGGSVWACGLKGENQAT